MTGLPAGWARARLADVLERLEYGYTAGATTAPVGPRFLRISDIQRGQVDWDRVPFCDCPDPARYALSEGDVVVARTGATTGKSYLLRGDVPESVFASYLIRLRIRPGFCPEYLHQFMQSPAYWSQLRVALEGSTRPGVNATKLGDLTIPVPPAREQRRIVARVTALLQPCRRARRALDAIPPLLDRLRQSILAAACRGDLSAAWRARNPDIEPADQLLERVRAERLRQAAGRARKRARGEKPGPRDLPGSSALPPGWAWSSVGELVDVQTGATPRRGTPAFYDGGTIPWLTSTVVNHAYVDSATRFITETALRRTGVKLFPPGTLLVAMYGEGRTRGTCTELRISATTNQALAALRTDRLDATLRGFIKLCLEHDYPQIRGQAGGGVQPNLNLTRVREIRLPIPPPMEQAEILSRVSVRTAPLSRVTEALSHWRDACDQLERAILVRAFRGQLVPQDPDDEPASVLLERIRAASGRGSQGDGSRTP